MLTAKQIIDCLKLQPNPAEGGLFASTYVSAMQMADTSLPGFSPTPKGRALSSAIYYFIEAGNFSAMHRVTGDMIYNFYTGDPVEMLLLHPDGSSDVCTFSSHISKSVGPMKIIPGGTWLGSRIKPGGDYALMGVSMSPGFDPADYTIGKREDLVAQYPMQKQLIEELTRN
jgi:predicted cupin superfamily sugar epimerase